MQYALLIYENEEEAAGRSATHTADLLQEYGAIAGELAGRGALVWGDGLRPGQTATTLRARGEEILITDGPFAEAREQLAGVFVLECADLDQALSWARRMPHASGLGAVEVRPVGASGA